MPQVRLHVIPTTAPDDVSGLLSLIADGALDPAALRAVLGKTEGNGCVNDFTRAFAVQALESALGDAADGVAMVMSGGTEGGLSPHLLTFERLDVDDAPGGTGSLAMGVSITEALPAEHLGRTNQITMVAAGVRAAMTGAGISDPADVHFVQIKCPLLTAARITEAQARGADTATSDTLKSMGLSRGASALGVALALGEITEDQALTTHVGTDTGIWSGRASTSAGVELLGHEILVLGMSPAWSGPLAIDHTVMADGIDTAPVRATMDRLGVPDTADLAALLAKTEPGTTGTIRGRRHTMLDDSDISATRHARAFTGGALAGLTGRTDLFVSGGAEHQGPDGGGPVAIIAQRKAGT